MVDSYAKRSPRPVGRQATGLPVSRAGTRGDCFAGRELFKEFQPDCVITDFEPMTAYLAHHYDLPLITIDNQHRMRFLKYECPPGLELEGRVTKNIIRAMVPRPDVSLVTAFCPGELRNQRTFVFPPIVRREVLRRQPTDGEHILVYVTSGFDSLLLELQDFGRERFHVYGYDRDEVAGTICFKSFSKEGFLDDLASAKAVIATVGFTLISEALFLRKPYLALPVTHKTNGSQAHRRRLIPPPGRPSAKDRPRDRMALGYRGAGLGGVSVEADRAALVVVATERLVSATT